MAWMETRTSQRRPPRVPRARELLPTFLSQPQPQYLNPVLSFFF